MILLTFLKFVDILDKKGEEEYEKKVMLILTTCIMIMVLGKTKVSAKIILPPEDILSTPYNSTLGGYAIYDKMDYKKDNAGQACGGYIFYKMPYAVDVIETVLKIHLAQAGSNVTIECGEVTTKTYSVTQGFARVYSTTYGHNFKVNLNTGLWEVGGGYNYTFGTSTEKSYSNTISESKTMTVTVSESFDVVEQTLYSLVLKSRFQIYVVQEFDIFYKLGCPYKVETGRYDVVVSKVMEYTEIVETDELSNSLPTVSGGILNLNNSTSLYTI